MSVVLEDMPKGPDTPLYPTSLFEYEDCPRKFLWSRGWDDIDLGGGPGKRKPSPPDEKDQSASLIGTVIQRVVEDFYNQKLWKDLDSLQDSLMSLCEVYYEEKLPYFNIGKFAPSRMEQLKTIKSGVKNFLITAQKNKLVPKRSVSEIHLKARRGDLYLGAKIDFILHKKEGVYLLDGKNTKYKMKYTNADQLRFYAMVYHAKNGIWPEKLGFLWYRFPTDEETGEPGIDWITVTERDIQSLEERSREAHEGMKNRLFHPLPKPKVCRFCDYESVCPERQSQKKENSKKRRRKHKSLPMISGKFTMDVDFE